MLSFEILRAGEAQLDKENFGISTSPRRTAMGGNRENRVNRIN
jgi:hypothetical protein